MKNVFLSLNCLVWFNIRKQIIRQEYCDEYWNPKKSENRYPPKEKNDEKNPQTLATISIIAAAFGFFIHIQILPHVRSSNSLQGLQSCFGNHKEPMGRLQILFAFFQLAPIQQIDHQHINDKFLFDSGRLSNSYHPCDRVK